MVKVACAVLHTDADGNPVPCPGYPHAPTEPVPATLHVDGPASLLRHLAYGRTLPEAQESPSGPLASALASLRQAHETGEPWILTQREVGVYAPSEGGNGYVSLTTDVAPWDWGLGLTALHDPHAGTGMGSYKYRSSLSLALGPLHATVSIEWGTKK